MEDTDRPPLDAKTLERLAATQYSVQKHYEEKLKIFLEDLEQASPLAKFFGSGDSPLIPPAQPIAVSECLGEYAIQLFGVESCLYPKDERLSIWLDNLARRVEGKIISHVLGLTNRPHGTFGSALSGRLTYHVSEEQMRQSIRTALKSGAESPPKHPNISRPARPLPASYKVLPLTSEPITPVSGRAIWRPIAEVIAATLNPIETTAQKIPADPNPPLGQSLIDLRAALLSEYKKATGNPSNRRIYTAKNSGIHKPDFYAWLGGKLPTDSAMTINLESFLRLKKPPIPRTKKG